jgi:hypothetical protein
VLLEFIDQLRKRNGRLAVLTPSIRQLGPLVDRIITLERSLKAAHATLDSQVTVISRLVERIAALEKKRG